MKVLIIRGGALGDTLMLLPALSVLSNRVEISFVGREPGLGFVRHWVHSAKNLECGGWHRLFGADMDGHPLPVPRADRVIAFFADETGRLGQRFQAFLPHASIYIFPSFPPGDRAIHVARYVAQCLRKADLGVDVDGAMENSLRRPLIQNHQWVMRSNRVLFHPGSGDKKKNHPPGWWCRLMDAFQDRAGETGSSRILLLGPAEGHLLPEFQTRLKTSGTALVHCPSTEELTVLLQESGLVIGHDSGICHLSAMLGTPTIALFRKTDPVQWQPLGPQVQVITRLSSDEQLVRNVRDAAFSLL
ncbi:MAG: glycosyltransferase family 9 protein [Thermodesulfobacteriota bacterium]